MIKAIKQWIKSRKAKRESEERYVIFVTTKPVGGAFTTHIHKWNGRRKFTRQDAIEEKEMLDYVLTRCEDQVETRIARI